MKNVILSLTVLTLASFSGCAALRAAAAKNAAIQRSVTSHTYNKACNEMWGAARNILFSQNYTVKSADAIGGLTLETEWRYDSNSGTNGSSSSRYMIQGQAPTPTTCQIVATKAIRGAQGNTHMERDWQLEWTILQQTDTAEATRIETEANAAGETARNQG